MTAESKAVTQVKKSSGGRVGGSSDDQIKRLLEERQRLTDETKALRIQLSALKNQVATLEHYKREHNKLEEELLRITKAVDAANEAIGITDPAGKQIYQNEAFTHLFRYTLDELNEAGGPLALFDQPEIGRLVFETVTLGCPWNGDVSMTSSEGRSIPVALKATAVKDEDGEIIGRISIYTDHTELKAAEAQVQETLAELARSNAELQQFTFVASHDLQEPLRMVASYVQLLEKRYGDRLDQDARDFIGFAVDGVARMKSLINDLLSYARVGAEDNKRRKTNLNVLLRQVVEGLSLAVDESGARITHDRLPTLLVDPGQISQLFQNLIGNAIKFRRDEPPRIHISAVPSGPDWVFAVRDNGIGIERAYAKRVFLIFQRLHTASEYPGNGIGLAICKNIIEKHRGKIWFESEAEKGSTFFFSLPAETESAPGRGEGTSQAKQGGTGRQ